MSAEPEGGRAARQESRPRSTMRIALTTLAWTLLSLLAAAVVAVYAGVYNVAATSEHFGFTRWIFGITAQRSIAMRADRVPAPPPDDQVDLEHGFLHYDAMCVSCHGAPGVERNEVGMGLNPKPPDLAEAVAEYDARELFWITKNGIRLAGMPAFGPTHTDAEIWGIVAMLEQLPAMTAAQYAALASRYSEGAQGHDMESMDSLASVPAGHADAPDSPPHSH